MTTKKLMHESLIDTVTDMFRTTFSLSQPTARLHPSDHDALVKELSQMQRRYAGSEVPAEVSPHDITLATPGGMLKVAVDPTIPKGTFRVLANRDDGLVNLLDGMFEVDIAAELAANSENFAQQFQTFVGGYRDQVKVVHRSPINSPAKGQLEKIRLLLVEARLSPWESRFLRDMRDRLKYGDLTSKQESTLRDVLSRPFRPKRKGRR